MPNISAIRGKTVECKCERCKEPFIARVADRKRGWARFCSKACKAIRQEAKTGKHAAYQERKERDSDGHCGGEFNDAHLFSNEDHNCSKEL